MTSISKYKVIHGPVDSIFGDMVQAAINTDWQPFGSPFFTRDMNGVVIGHQAVVIYAKDT